MRIILKLQQHAVFEPSLAEKHAKSQTTLMANILQHQIKKKTSLYDNEKHCFQSYANIVHQLTNSLIYHKSYSTDILARKHSHLVLFSLTYNMRKKQCHLIQSFNLDFHHTVSNCVLFC